MIEALPIGFRHYSVPLQVIAFQLETVLKGTVSFLYRFKRAGVVGWG